MITWWVTTVYSHHVKYPTVTWRSKQKIKDDKIQRPWHCPQNPRNNQLRPQQGRRTQTTDYYKQDEPIQAAHAIAENRTPQGRAHEILGYMANQDEVVKDELIKELRNGEDFPSAWTRRPRWGLYVVTLYITRAIDLCEFQFRFVQVTSRPTKTL